MSRSQRKRTAPNDSDGVTNSANFHSHDSGDNTPQADASPAIDYDKFASAILRQTFQGPPSSTEPQHDQHVALTPSAQLQPLPTSQPGVSTSGI